MKIKTFIQHRSVTIYFWLAYIIAWAGSFAAAGPKFLRGEEIHFDDWWLIGAAMLLAPSLTGIGMTLLVDGRSGLRDLWSRTTKWRVGGRWYVAILIFPLLILACLLPLAALVSPEFRPTFFSIGILMGLSAGFLEEIGWMGFAYPKMTPRTNALTASLVLGVLHVLWHFAANYLGAYGVFGKYWLPHFVAFCVAMVPMRVILSWVYVNTESVLMAQLMHASSSGFLAILVPMSISPGNDTLFYTVYSFVLWVVAIAIIIKFGKDLKVKSLE